MTHEFTFSTHPLARSRLWTWRCSCGAQLQGRMFGVDMTWLPYAEAMEKVEMHLIVVDAEIHPAFLER